MPIGKGALSIVYKVKNITTGVNYALKVFDKTKTKNFPEYTNHLLEISKNLSSSSIPPSIVSHKTFGETDDFFYLVIEYLPGVETLDLLIKKSGPLNPYIALDITSKIADSLSFLHSKSIIHADLKPSNVLLSHSDPDKALSPINVFLVDFGFAEQISSENIMLIGTYQYIHPNLKRLIQKQETSKTQGSIWPPIGPYIDIYALGVVIIRMLAGEVLFPVPLTVERIALLLKEKNKRLSFESDSVINQLSNLIYTMLSTKPTTEAISSETVASICRSLMGNINKCDSAFNITDNEIIENASGDYQSTAIFISKTLNRLENITESLEEATAILITRDNTLEVIESSQTDDEILPELKTVFSNALSRSKNSWRVSVGMTIISFILIIGLVTGAVAMTLITGENYWGLIFGGASVSLLIGTIIWRPFDRIFRATILSQQIEMIHIQTITAYRSTLDIERRIQIFREATESLRTLFYSHDTINEVKKK